MRRLAQALVTTLSLAACASTPPEPAAPSAADQERKEREDAARDARLAAYKKQEADASAARNAQSGDAPKKADSDDVQRCETSRADRVTEAKKESARYLDWWKSNDARVTYLRKHCEEFDSRGIQVVRERTEDGRTIDRLQSNGGVPFDVKCDGAPGRPKGIDARWLAEASEMIGKYNDPVSPSSTRCETADMATLGTSLTALHSDGAGMKRIIAIP